MTELYNNGTRVLAIRAAVVAMNLVVIQLFGCAAIGLSIIDQSRFDYVSAISESWK